MSVDSLLPPGLGDRLARARARHGVTTAAAAAALGVGVETIAIWEAGLEPPPGAAEPLAAWLDDLDAGRRDARRPVSLYALCERRRREAAGITELRREMQRMHRSLLRANEANDEQLIFVHETYLSCLASGRAAPDGVAALEERFEEVADRLAEMSRRVAYMRALMRAALRAPAGEPGRAA